MVSYLPQKFPLIELMVYEKIKGVVRTRDVQGAMDTCNMTVLLLCTKQSSKLHGHRILEDPPPTD